MELFERIKKISKKFTGSDKALAELLDLKQQTFCGYLREERQNNLWPLLPRILVLFPQISRDWLYFDEGEMLTTDQQTTSGHPVQRAGSPANVVTLGAKGLGQENTAQTEKLVQRIAELEHEISVLKSESAELTVELRGALKELRQLNEEKRELEDRLKAAPAFLESSENPEPATSPRPVTGALGGGMLGDFNKN